jgi:hypothetical protein
MRNTCTVLTRSRLSDAVPFLQLHLCSAVSQVRLALRKCSLLQAPLAGLNHHPFAPTVAPAWLRETLDSRTAMLCVGSLVFKGLKLSYKNTPCRAYAGVALRWQCKKIRRVGVYAGSVGVYAGK